MLSDQSVGFNSRRVRKKKAELNGDSEIDFCEFSGLDDTEILVP
jgi:hypothetical protein